MVRLPVRGRRRRHAAVSALAVGLLAVVVPGAAHAAVVVDTISVGGNLGYELAVNEQTNRVYSTYRTPAPDFQWHVAVIDGATNQVLPQLGGGGGEQSDIEVNSATDRVYVGVPFPQLLVWDGSGGGLVANIFPLGGTPRGIAVDESANRIWTANGPSGNVSVIDGATHTVTQTINVGGWAEDVALDPAGERAYVTNFDNPGFLSVIDMSTYAVLDTITIADGPWGVAVDPTRDRAYVTRINASALEVIDTVDNTIVNSIGIGATPSRIAVNPGDGRVYVTNNGSESVSVIDSDTETLLHAVTVGVVPIGIAVNTQTNRIYVANAQFGTVSVLDGAVDPVGPQPVEGEVPPGGTLSSGSDPTPADPIKAAVTAPQATGGTIRIDPVATDQEEPTGYVFGDFQVDITAPEGTATDPLALAFRIDGSLVPPGHDYLTLQVFRNGVPVADCTGPFGTASPDPCVSSRSFSGTDVFIVVLTSAASAWNIGVVAPFSFTGLFSPVDAPPALNQVRAGAGVPVKFRLGGDKGLDVLASDYPRSQKIECGSSDLVDPIEETVSTGKSTLHYDERADEYTYAWKTQASYAKDPNQGPCRQLVVRLDDGTTRRANFKFVK
jgi:YVTN family beta-propeller protein